MEEPLPSPRKEDRVRMEGVDFELAFSEDWVDVFDKKLEQAPFDLGVSS